MAIPLMTVLTAAPGIISAAADVLRVIRERKTETNQSDTDKFKQLENLIEQQAVLIEELAVNNRNLALAVRNNRIIAALAIVIGIAAGLLTIWI
jgi:hypothetical protein